jgi:hypothetical protein
MYLSRTTSTANEARSASSVMAWPPYLMTRVLSRKRRMYGNASIRTFALSISF